MNTNPESSVLFSHGDVQFVGDAIYLKLDGREYLATLHEDTDSNPRHADCYDSDAIAAWDADQWRYVGVVVHLVCPHCGSEDGEHGASLWGIEANFHGHVFGCASYLTRVAHELASEIGRELDDGKT